jgi:hypothetical protein
MNAKTPRKKRQELKEEGMSHGWGTNEHRSVDQE